MAEDDEASIDDENFEGKSSNDFDGQNDSADDAQSLIDDTDENIAGNSSNDFDGQNDALGEVEIPFGLHDGPREHSQDDPLDIYNAEMKEEELEEFHLCTNDRSIVDGLLNDTSDAPASNANLFTVPQNNTAMDESEQDDDVICDELIMPLPMASLPHGMVKQEGDEISGSMPFATQVYISVLATFFAFCI